MVPRLAASVSPVSTLELSTLSVSIPDLVNHKLWEWDPEICLKICPGNSDTCLYLKITNLEQTHHGTEIHGKTAIGQIQGRCWVHAVCGFNADKDVKSNCPSSASSEFDIWGNQHYLTVRQGSQLRHACDAPPRDGEKAVWWK